MCVIIVKNKGVNPPTAGTIEKCFTANPDGAGIAYVRGDKVIIEKGFLTLSSFKEKLTALNFDEKDIVLYHFRIGTHGKNNAENCHPFPLSKKIENLKKTVLSCNFAVTHNGIFGNLPKNVNNSDTQKFIAFVLSNFTPSDIMENPGIYGLLLGYCGTSSKLAFLTPDRVLTVGKFYSREGLLFSNVFHEIPSYYTYTGTGYKKENFDPHYTYKAGELSKINYSTPKVKKCANCGTNAPTLNSWELNVDLCRPCWNYLYREGAIGTSWKREKKILSRLGRKSPGIN